MLAFYAECSQCGMKWPLGNGPWKAAMKWRWLRRIGAQEIKCNGLKNTLIRRAETGKEGEK